MMPIKSKRGHRSLHSGLRWGVMQGFHGWQPGASTLSSAHSSPPGSGLALHGQADSAGGAAQTRGLQYFYLSFGFNSA